MLGHVEQPSEPSEVIRVSVTEDDGRQLGRRRRYRVEVVEKHSGSQSGIEQDCARSAPVFDPNEERYAVLCPGRHEPRIEVVH